MSLWPPAERIAPECGLFGTQGKTPAGTFLPALQVGLPEVVIFAAV
jgi:hypothetical protein